MAFTNHVLQMVISAHFPSNMFHLESIPESDDDLAQFAPTTFRAKQADLIILLREKVQNSPPSAFAMNDLLWTNHVTHDQGIHKTSMLAVILWDRLEDFIKDEQQHPHFPCNFMKDTVCINLPHSLRTPRAHSLALVLTVNLLPTLKLESHLLFFMFCLS